MTKINADKPHLWKEDIDRSIDFYNEWFVKFAPETFRNQRARTAETVAAALVATDHLRKLTPEVLSEHPGILPVLRMATAPPLARDRLIGLAHATKSLVQSMEGNEVVPPRLPRRMARHRILEELGRISDLILELADRDLFPWMQLGAPPTAVQVERASIVVADRLCGAAADPIIRNAQERRQLASLRRWLTRRGYRFAEPGSFAGYTTLMPGSFAFRLNVPAGEASAPVNIPVDCAIQPLSAAAGSLPILIEAKSAGDFTNTNKRRKEEAQKLRQLRQRYGGEVRYILLLCGYFGPDYLGYEAAEGFDWIWEHRLSDLGPALMDPARPSQDPTVLREDASYTVCTTTESERRRKQEQMDTERSAAERNRLGQFATPLPLAMQIVKRSVAYLPAELRLSFLEPACGTGVFFSALQSVVGRERIKRAVGVEIDARFVTAARELWQNQRIEVEEGDFFVFTAQGRNRNQFNLLCTNPPYVRHHHLPGEMKQMLRGRAASELGLLTSGLTGLYVYFVLLADPVLAEGAIASWLIPAEFLVVNYGAPLREYLRTRVTLLEVFQFDPEEVQFDDAWVSSCIVTYRKAPPPPDHTVELRCGADYAKATHRELISLRHLCAQPRWHIGPAGSATVPAASLRVADLFTVRRGIATGANDFFVMTRAQSRERRLPMDVLRPVVTSPRQIPGEVIEADHAGVPRIAEPLFLLDCSMPTQELAQRYPAVWMYLECGRKKGIADRYLCRSRSPWYTQEQRPPAPYLVSYMGRSTSTRTNPFRFFLNRSQAVATNGFLCLYPKPSLVAALKAHPEREFELLRLLNRIAPDTLKQNGRSYGGGLHKVEPSELLHLPLHDVPPWLAAISAEPQLDLLGLPSHGAG